MSNLHITVSYLLFITEYEKGFVIPINTINGSSYFSQIACQECIAFSFFNMRDWL